MSATERPKPGTSARERMIRSAVALFRERGIEGTSFTDVLEHSGAPRGSIYYHFPGGKAQLAEEATRYSGELIAAGLALSLAEKDPHAAVRSFAATWREILDKSEFASGCAVAAATIEGERTPAARDAAATAFERWQAVLAEAFTARGIDPERARGLATTTVAAIEGGILLARAQRSSEPLERVADELAALVASAQIASTKSRRRRSDSDHAARPRRGTGATR
jgi:TetR/AcrR family transcriptional regulator, lmrAB and yxaGH operons repressor